MSQAEMILVRDAITYLLASAVNESLRDEAHTRAQEALSILRNEIQK